MPFWNTLHQKNAAWTERWDGSEKGNWENCVRLMAILSAGELEQKGEASQEDGTQTNYECCLSCHCC